MKKISPIAGIIDALIIGVPATAGLAFYASLFDEVAALRSENMIIAGALFLAFSYITGVLIDALATWGIRPYFRSVCYELLKIESSKRKKFYKTIGQRLSKLTKESSGEEVIRIRDYIFEHGSDTTASNLFKEWRTIRIIRATALSFTLWVVPLIIYVTEENSLFWIIAVPLTYPEFELG